LEKDDVDVLKKTEDLFLREEEKWFW